jgi:hypothetical protein
MAQETLHSQVSEEIFDLSEYATESGEDQNWIDIKSLEAGEALTVRTCNSLYRLVMLNPSERKILIRGGQYLQQPTTACLLGSAIGRKIQVGRIVEGRGLGFSVGRRCFITSPIEHFERQKSGEDPAEKLKSG